MTWDELVAMARERLPEVEESTAYGTPALRVRGKFIGRLNGEHFNVRCEKAERDALVQQHPDWFVVTDHLRPWDYVAVVIAKVDPELCFELVEDKWRDVAPKKLLKDYEESRAGNS